jgi:hypothetical protein
MHKKEVKSQKSEIRSDNSTQAFGDGSVLPESHRTAFLALILTIFAALPVPAKPNRTMDQCEYFLNNAENHKIEKSGTPRLYQLLHDSSLKTAGFQSTYRTLARPEMQRFVDSANGHFRVHYNLTGTHAPVLDDLDNNTVPDYIDSALVYLEYAWDVVKALGYTSPKSDMGRGGSNAVDVYLQELSVQRYYGYTSPDTAYPTGSAYMVIDNDFSEDVYPSKGLNALKVTTIHEYFHVIHYSYYGDGDAVWWMEQSAVWMEDHAWDTVNDYIYYIGDFLKDRETSLDSNDSYMYAASLFAFMLGKKYGSDIIRTVWDTFKTRESGRIELFHDIVPGRLTRAIADLGVWSYFTADRANPQSFFTDSGLMKESVKMEKTLSSIPAIDSLSCRRHTFKYVEISPPGGLAPSDSLQVIFTDRNGGMWDAQVILYNSPTDFEVYDIPETQCLLSVSRSFRKAVLVLANSAPEVGLYRMVFSIKYGSDPKPVPTIFVLDRNYPNPFNKETVLGYSIPERAHVRIRIINLRGQTVKTLVDEIQEKGARQAIFDASGLSSGVYVAVLESGGKRLTRKMMYLK